MLLGLEEDAKEEQQEQHPPTPLLERLLTVTAAIRNGYYDGLSIMVHYNGESALHVAQELSSLCWGYVT